MKASSKLVRKNTSSRLGMVAVMSGFVLSGFCKSAVAQETLPALPAAQPAQPLIPGTPIGEAAPPAALPGIQSETIPTAPEGLQLPADSNGTTAPTAGLIPPPMNQESSEPTQPSLLPETGSSGTTPTTEDEPAKPSGGSLSDSASVESMTPPIMSTTKRFQFSADIRGIYDDNIFFSPTNPQSDYIFVASPKLSLNLGDYVAKDESYLTMNYNPEAILFTERSGENSLDHNLKTQIQYAIAKLAVGVEGGYQRLSGATPDLGERVERDVSNVKLGLKYGFGARVEVENNVLYSATNYTPTQFADFSEFVNETLARYQLTARTNAAVGVAFGRLEVDGFGDQTFERALVQILHDTSEHLTLKLKGGYEFRHTPAGDQGTPILAMGGEYKFTENTSLGLDLYREVLASGGSPGENMTRTGISARLRHRINERFVGELTAGYEQAEYAAASAQAKDGKGDRKDDYFYFRPSLTYELREDRRLQLYYMHRSNESAQDDFSFEGNQIGISAGMDF
jgi:hypothetical protein